jgi:hypothetical protein
MWKMLWQQVAEMVILSPFICGGKGVSGYADPV